MYLWYWFRANRVERLEAQREAILLSSEHGDHAVAHVRTKLRSPRRKRSAVELKLTMCLIARRQKSVRHRRKIWASF